MSNYSKRTLPLITRENGGSVSSEDTWLNDFARHLETNGVQSKSKADSLYDTLNSIIRGNKPKYPSVEAAVDDMRERSGLASYKSQLKTKIAAEEIDVPLFRSVPQIKQTIDNYIRDTRGNLVVPEIINRVKAIHKNDIADNAEWNSPSLLTYISNKNTAEKQLHPDTTQYSNLGKVDYYNNDVDPSNTDALHSLNPTTIK